MSLESQLSQRDVCLTGRGCNPHTEFDCTGAGEQCIPLSKACDRHDDCGNNADEDTLLCQHLHGISNCGCCLTSLFCMLSKVRLDFPRDIPQMSDSNRNFSDHCSIKNSCASRVV